VRSALLDLWRPFDSLGCTRSLRVTWIFGGSGLLFTATGHWLMGGRGMAWILGTGYWVPFTGDWLLATGWAALATPAA